MIRWIKTGRWARPAALLLAGILLQSCNLPASASSPGTPPASGNLAQEEQALDGGEGIAGTDDMPLVPLECPDPAHAYTALLTYNHYANYENAAGQYFTITIKGQQHIRIVDTDSPQISGDVQGIGNLDDDEQLTATMTVDNVGDCPTGKGTAKVKAKVTGTCSRGELTLVITERTDELKKVSMKCENAEPMFPFFMLWNTFTWKMTIGEATKNSYHKLSEKEDLWFGGGLLLGYDISVLDE
jgi:hypothetical protein